MRRINGKELENIGCIGKNSNLRKYMNCHTIEIGLDYEGTGGYCRISSREKICKSHFLERLIWQNYIKWIKMERTYIRENKKLMQSSWCEIRVSLIAERNQLRRKKQIQIYFN